MTSEYKKDRKTGIEALLLLIDDFNEKKGDFNLLVETLASELRLLEHAKLIKKKEAEKFFFAIVNLDAMYALGLEEGGRAFSHFSPSRKALIKKHWLNLGRIWLLWWKNNKWGVVWGMGMTVWGGGWRWRGPTAR